MKKKKRVKNGLVIKNKCKKKRVEKWKKRKAKKKKIKQKEERGYDKKKKIKGEKGEPFPCLLKRN